MHVGRSMQERAHVLDSLIHRYHCPCGPCRPRRSQGTLATAVVMSQVFFWHLFFLTGDTMSTNSAFCGVMKMRIDLRRLQQHREENQYSIDQTKKRPLDEPLVHVSTQSITRVTIKSPWKCSLFDEQPLPRDYQHTLVNSTIRLHLYSHIYRVFRPLGVSCCSSNVCKFTLC